MDLFVLAPQVPIARSEGSAVNVALDQRDEPEP